MSASARLTLFFDGDCPLCRREIDLLRRIDRDGRVELVDIARPSFLSPDPGVTREDLMARIHARRPDGRWLEGMDVFRAMWEAVGWGWLLAPTGWPILRPIFDASYRWFARNRLRLTGRADCDIACAPGAGPGRSA